MIPGGVMLGQTFADFPGQIQAGKIRIFLFQFLDNAKAVPVVLETTMPFHQAREHRFARVPERRMTEVVRERNSLGQTLVQPQRAGDVARDGGDFNGVRKARAQMIAGAVEKNLRFVFEPAKSARMNNPVAVALVMRAPIRRRFRMFATARVAAELRTGRENLPLDLFKFLTGAGHDEIKN
jgi:hypothetical protein